MRSTAIPSISPKLSARFTALTPSRPFFPCGASISASLSTIPSASQRRTTPRKIKPSPISSKYTQDFGAFLASANPNLPKNMVAELVKDHVLTLKDVIDAQAPGD